MKYEAWVIFDVETATSGDYIDEPETPIVPMDFDSAELKRAYFRGFWDVVEYAPFISADDFRVFNSKEDAVNFVRENS